MSYECNVQGECRECGLPQDTFQDRYTLYIGLWPDAGKVHINGDLLRKIPFFDRMLSSGMIESRTKIINLPTDDVELVYDMMRWVVASDSRSFASSVSFVMKSYVHKANLWILADKWLCPNLQNAIMHNLFVFNGRNIAREPDYSTIGDIFARVLPTSALARWFIDIAVQDLVLRSTYDASVIAEAFAAVGDLDFATAVAQGFAERLEPQYADSYWIDKPEDEYLVPE